MWQSRRMKPDYELIKAVTSILSVVVAFGAVAVASMGLATWRRQLRGSAEYDLARRVLRAVLRVRNEITAIRNPFILPAEANAALAEAGVTPSADRHNIENSLVYERRWNRLVQARADLDIELLEARILWPSDLQNAQKALASCVSELWSAVLREVRKLQDRGVTETADAREKREAILYQIDDDPSSEAFAARVEIAVAEFEKALRRHIGPRPFKRSAA